MGRKIISAIIDTTTVQGLFVFSGCELDTTISSNMDDYLLPAGASCDDRGLASVGLLPAAGPGPAPTFWPRQRFHATTSGAAMPKLEYVPTTIPTTRAKEKARSTWPPIRNRTSTVRNVRPLVKIVRESV